MILIEWLNAMFVKPRWYKIDMYLGIACWKTRHTILVANSTAKWSKSCQAILSFQVIISRYVFLSHVVGHELFYFVIFLLLIFLIWMRVQKLQHITTKHDRTHDYGDVFCAPIILVTINCDEYGVVDKVSSSFTDLSISGDKAGMKTKHNYNAGHKFIQYPALSVLNNQQTHCFMHCFLKEAWMKWPIIWKNMNILKVCLSWVNNCTVALFNLKFYYVRNRFFIWKTL